MPAVGAKELKNRLAHYLRLVRSGARFLVTHRGRPVAELAPVEERQEQDHIERVLAEAAARGEMTLPRVRGFARFRPLRLKGGSTLSAAVREDRRWVQPPPVASPLRPNLFVGNRGD